MSSAISRTVMWSGSSISFGGWSTVGSGRAGAPSGRRLGGIPCDWSGPRPCPCGCGRVGFAPGAGGRGPCGGSGLPSEDTGRPASGARLGAPGPPGLAGGRAPGSPGLAGGRAPGSPGLAGGRAPGSPGLAGGRAPGSPGLAGGRAPGSPGLAGGRGWSSGCEPLGDGDLTSGDWGIAAGRAASSDGGDFGGDPGCCS